MSARVIVITGSSSGIGQSMAERFAAPNEKLIVHGLRNLSNLDRTSLRVRERGSEVRSIVGDVCDPDSRRRMVDAAFAWHGRVDVWINAAGADVLTGSNRHASFEAKLERLWKTMLKERSASVA